MSVRYVVLNENTLGYINSLQPRGVGVLAGSVILGGHDWLNGPVSPGSGDTIRPATVEDFDTYRVMVPPDFQQ